mmetsp:Transcript_10704/g.30712  ORF Transcript_10704/g.30712 Transcript_10704/m.30712 type:complete len:356 (+) Transcript_10704:526-1593(+)
MRLLDLTSPAGSLDAALVLATNDAEETVLAPVLVPAVHNGPVLDTVLDAPADHLDGVAAEGLAGHVLVDASFVGLEVFVHGERNRDGAVLVDLLHEALLAVDSVGGLGVDLVGLVGLVVVGLTAGLLAGGGRVRRQVAAGGHVVGVLAVVEARRKGVGLAGGSSAHILVVATGRDTVAHEELPRTRGLAAVAAHGAVEEARAVVGLFGRAELVLSVHNAPAVIQSLRGRERPAAAAAGLVPDVANHVSAGGPVVAGIKGIWEGDRVLEGLLREAKIHVAQVVGHDGAQHALGLGHGHALEARGHVGLPGGASAVHGIHGLRGDCRNRVVLGEDGRGGGAEEAKRENDGLHHDGTA